MFSYLKYSCLFLALFLTSGLAAQKPELHEPGLKLTMYAEDPDIVTPVGMVVG